MQPDGQLGAIRFAERVLQLLDGGSRTATYKFAVLLAIMDLCLEQTQVNGSPPTMLTTVQLAHKVIELYWGHTVPFVASRGTGVLRQNTRGQAEVVSLIGRFRAHHAPDPSTPRWQARLHAPDPYDRLVRAVEWKLIEMPLPRLQIIGNSHVPLLYEIGWDRNITSPDVASYLRGEPSAFSNAVTLLPGVGEYLLQLNTLLRPLVQRLWADMVARVNGLEESQLDEYLFGATRTPTVRVRRGLWDWQDGRCFYCGQRIKDPDSAHVDHFIPWARYPDDSLDNLVLADIRCNLYKKASLAAIDHLVRWTRRLDATSREHAAAADLAKVLDWEREPEKNLGVARGIYLRLPHDAKLWLRGREYLEPDFRAMNTALIRPDGLPAT